MSSGVCVRLFHNSSDFLLVDEPSGLALDVKSGDIRAGADVVLFGFGRDRRVGQNQLWYLDSEAILRSTLNHFVIEAGWYSL
jgi:hypothetical protein